MNSYIGNDDVETLPSQVHRESQQFFDEPPVITFNKKLEQEKSMNRLSAPKHQKFKSTEHSKTGTPRQIETPSSPDRRVKGIFKDYFYNAEVRKDMSPVKQRHESSPLKHFDSPLKRPDKYDSPLKKIDETDKSISSRLSRQESDKAATVESDIVTRLLNEKINKEKRRAELEEKYKKKESSIYTFAPNKFESPVKKQKRKSLAANTS